VVSVNSLHATLASGFGAVARLAPVSTDSLGAINLVITGIVWIFALGSIVILLLRFAALRSPGISAFLAAAVFAEVIAICVGSGKFYPWYVGMFFPMALLLEEGHWMRELALVLSLTELLHFTPLQRQPITTYLLSTAVPLVVVAWRARGSRRSAARFATEP